LKTFRVAGVTNESAGKIKLCPVRNRVPVAERFHPEPEKTSDVSGKPRLIRPVHIRRLLIYQPRAVEKRQEPVVKNIKKGDHRTVARVVLTIVRELRDVQRH